MLGMPASLKGSLHGKPAFARAMFIAGLAIALLPLQTIQTNAAEKRSYHVMNIKLYAYNKWNGNSLNAITGLYIMKVDGTIRLEMVVITD
jgi:hypothetical protein